MNLEKALRQKYRFPSPVGLLTLEQVFDLPLIAKKQPGDRPSADLDSVAKTVNSLLKKELEESFVETSVNKAKAQLEEQLEILKHIIAVKKAEAEEAATAHEKREKKQLLLSILADKNAEALKSKTPEELRAMIETL